MKAGKREENGVLLVEPRRAPLVVSCLLLSLAACGSPVSEKAPAASMSKGATAGAGVGAGVVPRGSESGNATDSSKQNDQKAASIGQTASDTDERDNRSIPGIPETVVRDLGSADARDRYRALEHWVGKGVQAPMDPVYDAMEDEDEGVREKATAIVEQRWAAEQEKERG